MKYRSQMAPQIIYPAAKPSKQNMCYWETGQNQGSQFVQNHLTLWESGFIFSLGVFGVCLLLAILK
jgi:hypothetical protein